MEVFTGPKDSFLLLLCVDELEKIYESLKLYPCYDPSVQDMKDKISDFLDNPSNKYSPNKD